MPLKKAKDQGSSPNGWTFEPEQETIYAVRSDPNIMTEYSQQTRFGVQDNSPTHYQLRVGEQKPQKHVVFDGPAQWPDGGAPMGVKRSKEKKKKKDKKKKKKSDMDISTPMNVRHVGMQNMTHLTTPLDERSNYPVEHLATMAVEGQLSHVSPYESIRKVRDLVQKGNLWTKEIILSVSPSELTIKDGSTRSSLNMIPMGLVIECKYIQDSGGNVLMVSAQDPDTSQPKVHFFQCTKGSAETICNQVNQAKRNVRAMPDDRGKGSKVKATVDQSQALRDNWVLEQRPHPPPQSLLPPPPFSPPPPPPASQPPPPPSMSYPAVPANPHDSNSPALPGNNRLSPYTPVAQSLHAGASPYQQDQRDDISIRSGSVGTPGQRQKRSGDLVTKASNKYTSNVHKTAASGGAENEIKRTIKASKIQRDVDILNHVFDDLDGFMQLLKDKAAAWTELERKSKKSRRKKNDAVLEALKRKAEPPNEHEFILTYQKCKYGINQIAKLGHHLSSPSTGQLIKEIFVFIQQFINLNKGPQLASGVVVPLFTSTAFNLMTKKLSPKEQETWNQLGGNWLMTVEQWPASRPLPPEYVIEFTDGCIPPNLHNASDSPANFPTLDTLPREQRSSDYSDVYDGDQSEESSGLMINPAVMAVVASKAAMVTSPILPGIINRRSSDASIDNRAFGGPSNRSQLSLNSEGSNEQEDKKMAKVLLDYQASALEELTIRRGEKVEVLDDSRNWWKIKNRLGSEGFVPSNLLELVVYKKKTGSKSDIHQADEIINIHGRNVPAPPKFSPPPVPSPADNRRPSISSGKYSPQMSSQMRKTSHHPQSLPTVAEVSESRSSTMSRPPLAPPPPFSPAPPPIYRANGAPPPPPPPPGLGGPPPPPPPPVLAPAKQMSLSEMVSQHKLKTVQQGKSQKKKINTPDNGFDIASAMKTRRPLRKTTSAMALEGVAQPPGQAELQIKMRGINISNKGKEEQDGDYIVLPWKANKDGMSQWLINNGYPKCAENFTVSAGKELYAKNRDQLKEMCGISEGARLFSHLQKDKTRAEKEGGAAKQSEFQKLMLSRKAAADAGDSEEPTIMRGWGKNPPPEQQNEVNPGQPSWKQEIAKRKANKLTEKETVLDDTMPRLRDRLKRKDTMDMRSYSSRENTMDQRRRRPNERGTRDDYEDEGRGGRRRNERSRHNSDRYEEEKRGRGGRSRAISDDEGYRTRRNGRGKRDTWSDNDSDYEDRRRRGRRGRHRGPTNVDDFDEDDYSSNSYSSEYSDSDSSGSDSDDSRRRNRRRRDKLRSSASVSELTGTAWALTGENGKIDNIDQRIKNQQAEIKKQLATLTQLQSETGVKALPSQQQTVLQKDLQKLEQLQTKLRYKQGDQNLQMQLLGQQMLLCEHLKEAQQMVISRPNLAHSQSGQNLRLQMIQQQQQALAEQQHQLLFEQQRQMEAEQQRQMMLAAEQQRQMQLAAGQQRQMQMAQLMQGQYVSPQQTFGMGGMPQMYSPYTGTVGYF